MEGILAPSIEEPSATLCYTRRMKHGAGKLIAVVALMLALGAADAQQSSLQSYDVELIIFRNLSSSATPEDWSQETGIAAHDTLDDENDAPVAPVPAPVASTETFPELPASKFKLTAIADTLRRSRGYQPLAHFGWTQPGFPLRENHYLSIDSQAPGSGLTGRVALSRGRYLHLALDLTLEPAGSGERYVLRQTRRMRSNERHYIDHPKFGVIAVVTQSGAGGN